MTTPSTGRKKMQLGDYTAAQKMHQTITQIVKKVLAKERPKARMGVTTAQYNSGNQKVTVLMNGDTTPSQVTALPGNFPVDVGSIVSVKGASGRGQQVEDIFTGRRGAIAPAQVGQTLVGGSAAGYETYKTSFYSNQGNSAAGGAWYYGRWISPTNIGLADIKITYGGAGSEFVNTYQVPLLFNETGFGTWVRVRPIIQTDVTAGLTFQLEVMIGLDPLTGLASFDVRVRTTGLDPGGTNNIRLTMDLYGTWTQNQGEGLWSGAPAAVVQWLPTTWDNPYRKWTFLDTPGNPVHAGSWADYDGGMQFPPAKFYQDSKGKVRLSGLVRAGSGTIFTLPAYLWPDSNMSFDGNANGIAGSAEIRVSSVGVVSVFAYATGGSNTYVSLDKIEFFPASAHIPWQTPTLSGVWVNFGSGFSTARYYIDEDGICHWTGMITGGANGSAIATVAANPAIAMDTLGDYFCRPASGGLCRIDISTTQMVLDVFFDGGSTTYVSLDGLSYPAVGTTVRWFTSTGTGGFINGWANYQVGVWNSYRFCKDSAGVVRISGLVANATTSTVGIIAFALPPGFRPAYQLIYNVIGNPDVLGRIDILPTGSITLLGFGATGNDVFLGLGDLRWIADA